MTKVHRSVKTFVARRASATNLRQTADEHQLGCEIDTLDDVGSGFVKITVPPTETSPREVWQRLKSVLGDEVELEPILTDDKGTPLFPTGVIHIRFSNAPSDAELVRFAQRHKLVLRERNRFQQAQASFSAEDPKGTYLPDVTDRVGSAPEVAAAWEETKSQFRRTDP